MDVRPLSILNGLALNKQLSNARTLRVRLVHRLRLICSKVKRIVCVWIKSLVDLDPWCERSDLDHGPRTWVVKDQLPCRETTSGNAMNRLHPSTRTKQKSILWCLKSNKRRKSLNNVGRHKLRSRNLKKCKNLNKSVTSYKPRRKNDWNKSMNDEIKSWNACRNATRPSRPESTTHSRLRTCPCTNECNSTMKIGRGENRSIDKYNQHLSVRWNWHDPCHRTNSEIISHTTRKHYHRYLRSSNSDERSCLSCRIISDRLSPSSLRSFCCRTFSKGYKRRKMRMRRRSWMISDGCMVSLCERHYSHKHHRRRNKSWKSWSLRSNIQ